MKVLSIDVGIKNLAFCLLDTCRVYKWEVLNVSEQITQLCSITEKSSLCNKPAKFTKDGNCFCLKHAKKQCYQIPTPELKHSYINKQKIQRLYELADKYNLKYEQPCKKCDLISLLDDYSSTQCFQVVDGVNASKIDLVTIGKNIKIKMDAIFSESSSLMNIDHIIIENQISPIANRMKTIQGMIAQYFIMKNTCQNIEFVSSVNKLKQYETSEKSKYSDRKKLGVSKCLEVLNNNHEYLIWSEYFSGHKKKDDLADAFLQGIWFLEQKV